MPRVPRVPGRYYSVHDDTMQALADAVRYRTGTVDEMTIGEMTEELGKQYFEKLDDQQYAGIAPEPWEWPEEWPDLNDLPIDTQSGDDTIWMLYDADYDVSAIAWHIDTGNNALTVTADIGHIENGSFVVDETATVNNNTNYIKWLDEYSGLIVVRFTGHIIHCYAVNATANNVTQNHRQQPMLARVAYVPNLTYLNYSANYSWGMWLQESDKVSNGEGTALTSISLGWSDCQRLRNIDLTGLNTPNVTNMTYAFSNCMALAELDIAHFDVGKVTNFSNTFNGCYNLTELDFTGWDTGAATNMSNMFYNCRQLETITGIEDFDTTNVTNLSSMFFTCLRLIRLDLHTWNVEKVTNLSSMFSTCRGIQEIDLHGWDAPLVTTLASMFSTCQSVKVINLTDFETGNLVTTVASMFYNCYALQHIDISGIKVTSACTSIYSMFSGCWSLKELAFPEWNVSGLGSGNNTANSMFINCYSLERITGISDWQFNFTNSLGSMFFACRSLKELDISGWKVDTITNLSSMFSNCWSLRELDLSDWNPENCTTLASMFNECHSLRTVGNLSGWNTGKVTTLASMFNACLSLEEIEGLEDWDVSKVTTTASMFSSCVSLKEVTIRNWNLAACTTIATMFRYCYNLKKAVLSGWQLPKLTSTSPAQFLGDCWNLEDVDPPAIPLNHSYAGDRSLSHEALIKIINALPTVTTARTINLTATNVSRLSADEKAVATAKKWTIAN